MVIPEVRLEVIAVVRITLVCENKSLRIHCVSLLVCYPVCCPYVLLGHGIHNMPHARIIETEVTSRHFMTGIPKCNFVVAHLLHLHMEVNFIGTIPLVHHQSEPTLTVRTDTYVRQIVRTVLSARGKRRTRLVPFGLSITAKAAVSEEPLVVIVVFQQIVYIRTRPYLRIREPVVKLTRLPVKFHLDHRTAFVPEVFEQIDAVCKVAIRIHMLHGLTSLLVGEVDEQIVVTAEEACLECVTGTHHLSCKQRILQSHPTDADIPQALYAS